MTSRDWPHVYLHTWQVTGNEFFHTILEEILDYVVAEMMNPADSPGYQADTEGGHHGPHVVELVLVNRVAQVRVEPYSHLPPEAFQDPTRLNDAFPGDVVVAGMGPGAIGGVLAPPAGSALARLDLRLGAISILSTASLCDTLTLGLSLPIFGLLGATIQRISAEYAMTFRLRSITPHSQIVALTAHTDDARVVAALRAGATGYVRKDAEPEILLVAVRAAARGQSMLDPAVDGTVLQDLISSTEIRRDLTERELALRLLAKGRTNRQIAEEVVLGEETIKTHVGNILVKLHLAHRTQAVVHALLCAPAGLSASVS